MSQILMKHSMSRASDATVDYEFDVLAHTITLRMEFLAVTLLERLLSYTLPSMLGIEPWYDDEQQEGRALWRIVLIVGEHRYRVRLFKQISLVPKHDEWALELHEANG